MSAYIVLEGANKRKREEKRGEKFLQGMESKIKISFWDDLDCLD